MFINETSWFEVHSQKYINLAEAVVAAQAGGTVVFLVRPDGSMTLAWAPPHTPLTGD